ncbi:MAG: SDR family NAD(P)-dependent oxidoreductase [Thermodesulfobacteriota bacterium]
MDLELTGKVAIVTGAGQGIGREIARVLAGEGVKVAVNDYYRERAEAVAQEILDAGGQALGLRGDVTDLDSAKAVAAQAVERFGPVDILVNNAGVPVTVRSGEMKRTAFADVAPADWPKDIDLSFKGCLNFTYAVIHTMIKRKSGKIVNIISDAGRVGEANLSVYGGAKGAVLAFSKSLAREVGRYAVNVNCISLGAVAHEAIRHVLDPDARADSDEMLKKMLRAYPVGQGLGRIGRPEDVAFAAAFLASPRACFITGQCLGVNGGYAMV